MCNIGDALSSEDGLPKPPEPYYESLLEARKPGCPKQQNA